MSAPRPVIAAVSQATNLGSNADGSVRVRYGFPISTAMPLPALTTGGKAVLMSPGSMTHHSDMHARYIELEKVDASHDPATGLTTMVYDMPIETVAPRGYYMLFALTDGGVPSEAAWIQITQ
ncbi:MAG: galactose oxidase early set domain-containing protein [Rhodoglobus sp.]